MNNETWLELQGRSARDRREHNSRDAIARSGIAEGRTAYESRSAADLGGAARRNDETWSDKRRAVLAEHTAQVVAQLKHIKEGDEE